MTLWRFFTTRFTDHLEQENRELKNLLAMERQEVRRLTEAAIPTLQRVVNMGLRVPDPVGDALKKLHSITKAEDQQSATCTCGWKDESRDPVELQTAISEHYRENFPTVKTRRPTPSERIRTEEEKSFKESQETRRQA